MLKADFLDKVKMNSPSSLDIYTYESLPDSFLCDDRIPITCPKHGDFLQKAIHHYYHKAGCPKCADNVQLTQEQFIEKAIGVHGLRYDYSCVVYVNGASKIKIGCPTHGVFEQRAGAHLQGYGCRDCGHDTKRLSVEDFRVKATALHGGKYDYSLTAFRTNKDKVKIKCPKHGVFEQVVHDHLKRQGCHHCKTSKGEMEISETLTRYGIKFVREHKLPLSMYRYDFYLPEQNILIEFHGIQHYKPVELWGGRKALRKQRVYDRKKRELAKASNIPLITLNYLHQKSNRMEETLIRGFKNVYFFWIKENDVVKVFRRGQDIRDYYKLKYSPLNRVIVENLLHEHPGVKLLF